MISSSFVSKTLYFIKMCPNLDEFSKNWHNSNQKFFMCRLCYTVLNKCDHAKGQLISEWIYEDIISPKIRTNNLIYEIRLEYKDIC